MNHTLLSLTLSLNHECISKTVKFHVFYNYMLLTLSGFYHLQKVRALRCSLTCVQLWVLSWFSPTLPDPCILHHQVFGSILIRLPCYCLYSLPSSLSTPPAPATLFRMHLQVLKQRVGFFAISPPQSFQVIPTPTWYPALWGSFLTLVCLYILVR